MQKSKERLENAAFRGDASPRSSIERIFAFLHAKAAAGAAPARGEVDLLLEVIAETAAELERERGRTGQLRRRLSELQEASEREETQRQQAESEKFEKHMTSEAEKRELILRERNLAKALAQARADLETLTLWKAQELQTSEEPPAASSPAAGLRRDQRANSDGIAEAAEQRARRMQQDRLRSVMNKYYYV